MKRVIAIALVSLAPMIANAADKDMKDMDMQCDQKCMEKCMQMKEANKSDTDMKCMHMKESDMHDMHQAANDPNVKSHHAVGIVKSVNESRGTVVLDHEPVPTLDWPAMTMGFKAKDKAMVKGLRAGQKVEFDFQKEGSQYVITAIK